MIYGGYAEHDTYHNISKLLQASLNKRPSQIPVLTLTLELILNLPETLILKLNRTLLTKDPSTKYRYYAKLRIAATDDYDAASFTRVCFVKFICLCNVSDFIL